MDRKALGHSDPLLTHELGLRGDGATFAGAPPPHGDCEATWKTPMPELGAAVSAEFRSARAFAARKQSGEPPEATRVFCAGAILVSMAGKPDRPAEWRAPLMNIRVERSLLANHNDIYDPRFVSFLRELYMDTLVATFHPR